MRVAAKNISELFIGAEPGYNMEIHNSIRRKGKRKCTTPAPGPDRVKRGHARQDVWVVTVQGVEHSRSATWTEDW